MLDIESKKYSSRKEYEYDDDIGILFYKGQKVTKSAMEDYRGCWLEEDEYFDDLAELLDDIGYEVPFDAYNLDEEDRKEKWETVWDNLEWNEETKSYKYKNWEIVVLDI